MDCIKWLDSNNIKWFPLLLNEKKEPLKINHYSYDFKTPTFNDFKNLSDEQIKKRQGVDIEYKFIAVDTSKINMIDIDNQQANDKYGYLINDNPYFLSITNNVTFYSLKNFNFSFYEVYFLYFGLFLGFGFKVPI